MGTTFITLCMCVCVCMGACVYTCIRASTGLLISICKEGPFLGSMNIYQIEKSMCVCVYVCVRACFSTYVRFIWGRNFPYGFWGLQEITVSEHKSKCKFTQCLNFLAPEFASTFVFAMSPFPGLCEAKMKMQTLPAVKIQLTHNLRFKGLAYIHLLNFRLFKSQDPTKMATQG